MCFQSKMNGQKFIKPTFLRHQHRILFNSTRSGWFDNNKKSFFKDISTKEDPTFFSETEPNPLSDIEERIEKSKAKLVWRKPHATKTTFLTEGLRLLAPERTQRLFEMFQQPLDKESMLKSIELKRHAMNAMDQRFIADRHRILGNDLAAAHFLVARGGEVRQVNFIFFHPILPISRI